MEMRRSQNNGRLVYPFRQGENGLHGEQDLLLRVCVENAKAAAA